MRLKMVNHRKRVESILNMRLTKFKYIKEKVTHENNQI